MSLDPTVATEKQTVRALVRERLRTMPVSERERQSALIRAWLAPVVATGTVLAFAPLPEEVDLWPLLARLAPLGRLVLPRVASGGALTLHRIANLDALRAGPLRLREPGPEATLVPPDLIDVVLVPGLAFTEAGERLGRGRGMFDRLLARFAPSVRTIGVAFAEQRFVSIPCEAHDVRCRELVPNFG